MTRVRRPAPRAPRAATAATSEVPSSHTTDQVRFTFDPDAACWTDLADVVADLRAHPAPPSPHRSVFGAADHLLDAVGTQHPLPEDLSACANAHASPAAAPTAPDAAREEVRAQWAQVLRNHRDRALACDCGRTHHHDFAATFDASIRTWIATDYRPQHSPDENGGSVADGVGGDGLLPCGLPAVVAHFVDTDDPDPLWHSPRRRLWSTLRFDTVDQTRDLPDQITSITLTHDRPGHATLTVATRPGPDLAPTRDTAGNTSLHQGAGAPVDTGGGGVRIGHLWWPTSPATAELAQIAMRRHHEQVTVRCLEAIAATPLPQIATALLRSHTTVDPDVLTVKGDRPRRAATAAVPTSTHHQASRRYVPGVELPIISAPAILEAYGCDSLDADQSSTLLCLLERHRGTLDAALAAVHAIDLP